MIESDSLDRITINSNDILTFENNYYNRKNNNKLEKNIIRLFNSYLLSQNQNGGNDNNLSSQIKKRLYKKIVELGKNFIEGGGGNYWGVLREKVIKPQVQKPEVQKPEVQKPEVQKPEKSWFEIAGNAVTVAAIKTGFIDDDEIKKKIKDKILRNENKIIDNILESLSRVINIHTKDGHMTGLKHIFKYSPENSNTNDDKEWLLKEITLWINNNKKKIIDQINKYILEFIESKQSQLQQQQRQQQPPQPQPQQQQQQQPAPSVFDIFNNQRQIEVDKQNYFKNLWNKKI